MKCRRDDPCGDDFFLPACLIAALMIGMFLVSWNIASEGERATSTVPASEVTK
jgi:hypothetical protein